MSIKIDYHKCTGCEACKNICKRNAISMRPDSNGFAYPFVNIDLCVECGDCFKVCSYCTDVERNSNLADCYAVWAEDKIRQQSSSGGCFTVLAEKILDNDGYVCGAAFVDHTIVKHIVVDNKEKLKQLRTSKYIQSEMGTIYKEIKKLLNDKKTVLFAGTPCQIAGLKLYLGDIQKTLFTVDVLCHGVPSQQMFNKYLEEEFAGEKVKSINFRSKENGGGWCYLLVLNIKTDRKEYFVDINKSSYYKAFDKRLSLRKCCGECEFSSPKRVGDITLGDFWGIGEYDKTLDDGKGTSFALINSLQGEKLFDSILEDFSKVRKVPLIQAVKWNQTLAAPIKEDPLREEFLDYIRNHSIKEGINKYAE